MFFQPGTIITPSIRHAVEAQTAGLWIVAGVLALAVVAALGQILAGFVRLTPSSRESLRAIGYTAIQGSAEEVASAATLVVTGTRWRRRLPASRHLCSRAGSLGRSSPTAATSASTRRRSWSERS